MDECFYSLTLLSKESQVRFPIGTHWTYKLYDFKNCISRLLNVFTMRRKVNGNLLSTYLPQRPSELQSSYTDRISYNFFFGRARRKVLFHGIIPAFAQAPSANRSREQGILKTSCCACPKCLIIFFCRCWMSFRMETIKPFVILNSNNTSARRICITR